MNLIWKYEDYVNYLAHKNIIIRRWAFDAIENRYPNRYTDAVSNLLGDADHHLACAAPRYLAKHNAVQHAPAILESFLNGQDNVPSNCATALAKMKYEPAIEDIIGSLSTNINSSSLFGIFDYLGNVCNENSRDTLISAATQIKDPLLQGAAFSNLLRHNNSENMILILKTILKSAKQNKSIEHSHIKAVADFWDARGYFNDLTMYFDGDSIIENPKAVLKSFFKKNPQISVKTDQFDILIKNLEKDRHHDFVTSLMFEVQNIVRHRYDDPLLIKDSCDLFTKDTMAVVFFKELSKQPSIWKKLNKYSGIDLFIALLTAVYFSILEREVYLKVMHPEADLEELIQAVIKAGSRLPEEICKKIVGLSPLSELMNALTEGLNTWGDIWIVKIMGQIGSKKFVPDLIRILNITDSMEYIYSEAIRSIRSLEEAADEIILKALQNHEIKGWNSVAILEYLPYSESFDLISNEWDDGNSEFDSYETLAYCLKGIGDKRGIEKLQTIYHHGNNADYIADSLECLGLIHKISIPELHGIHEDRKEEAKRQQAREKEFNDSLKDKGNKGNIIPFKRGESKVGRNDPCPCGSGKKYKKCCLDK